MAAEGSELAEKAIAEREAAIKRMRQSDETQEEKIETDSEWDEFDDEIADPFATPTNSTERKRAAWVLATKETRQTVNGPRRNPMDSTTGRRLKQSDMTFEIDLSEYQTNIGGMVISGGPVLDEILEELEDELLSSDMGHDAVSSLITNLRSHLIGSRVSRKTPLSEVVERGLRGALLSLLQSGYWDFDRTIRDFVSEDAPAIIMMVGVNGTGKTTTSAKIAKRLDDQGFGVVLAAADTFRAGAIDQLAAHAERLGIRCIKSQRGGDSAAVARDAI
ncbi:MAG: signal recognition particle receptor subunit alpha, partial [Candidatus Thermoplasmatota archaeon]|nr:signal recognition particle receptor subunit alpha [Candidatus Thermoplasmatota archaeon]